MIIENDILKVEFELKGGQIISVFHKALKRELMKAKSPSAWGWVAPNLFPIIGALKNDELIKDGTAYSLAKHGLLRNALLKVVEHSESKIIFEFTSNVETLKHYPFHFQLLTIYELVDHTIIQSFQLTNPSNKTIYYNVGGHPGFKVPLSQEPDDTHYFEFSDDFELVRSILTDNGLIKDEILPLKLDNNRIVLTDHLFDEDALIFKSLKSTKIKFASEKSSNSIIIQMGDFTSLGLWSKDPKEFVCIEPWLGYADLEQGHTDISSKEGALSVNPNSTSYHSFIMEFNLSS